MLRALSLFVVLILPGCASIQFQRQQVRAEYNAEADSVQLLLVYENVHSGEEEFVRAIAEGQRVFVLHGWPFEFDLEDLDETESELERRAAVFARGVRVEDSGTFVEDGRPGCWQRIVFEDASELGTMVDLAARWVFSELGDHDPDDHEWDADTHELIRHRLEQGQWMRFGPSGLTVRVPLSEADFARWLAWLARGPEEVGRPTPQADLLAPLVSASYEAGNLLLSFGDAQGRMAWTIHRPQPSGEEGLGTQLGRAAWFRAAQGEKPARAQ